MSYWFVAFTSDLCQEAAELIIFNDYSDLLMNDSKHGVRAYYAYAD